MATTTIRNGVDVARLIATIDAIKQEPTIAQFTFRAGSTWESGARSRGRIDGFVEKCSDDMHVAQSSPLARRMPGDSWRRGVLSECHGNLIRPR